VRRTRHERRKILQEVRRTRQNLSREDIPAPDSIRGAPASSMSFCQTSSSPISFAVFPARRGSRAPSVFHGAGIEWCGRRDGLTCTPSTTTTWRINRQGCWLAMAYTCLLLLTGWAKKTGLGIFFIETLSLINTFSFPHQPTTNHHQFLNPAPNTKRLKMGLTNDFISKANAVRRWER